MAVLTDTPLRSVRLADGRRLAYYEYGSPGGWPLVFMHGTPGSHHTARWFFGPHQHLLDGVRLLVPERPGIGGSTHDPRRTTGSFARDVEALADHLGLGRFAVMGVSGGGPHALACAAVLPERLDGVAVLSGMSCVGGGGPLEAMPGATRMLFAMARRAPWLLQAMLRLQSRMMVRGMADPATALANAERRAPAAERAGMLAVMGDPDAVVALRMDTETAYAQGPLGVARDYAVFAGPWDVRLADADVDVHLWHGTTDTLVPVALGRGNAAALPRCTTTYGEYGHFAAIDIVPEALAALRATTP